MEVKAQIDIHKLIDDAMEKKDRDVNIYISNYGTSIYVNPIRDEDEPHWIDITPECEPNVRAFMPRSFVCSECGNNNGAFTSTYCPFCGEKMHGIRKEKT